MLHLRRCLSCLPITARAPPQLSVNASTSEFQTPYIIPSTAVNMAQNSQTLASRKHNTQFIPKINFVWTLVCVSLLLRGAVSQPWSKKSSVTRAEALATVIVTTTTSDVTPSQVTSIRAPKPFTLHNEIDSTVTTTLYHIDTVNVTSVSAIDADRPDAGRYLADKARTADPLSHSPGIAGDDASSKIRTIFFEIVGACIGVATLSVAVLALRRMPKQKQPDLESPPLGRDSHLPSQRAQLQLTQSFVEPVELDAVQTAIKIQYEQPVIRN